MPQGAAVTASDISQSMATEASRRYQLALEASGVSPPETAPTFEALDLESASGRYHTVACLDVMIHYPQVRKGEERRQITCIPTYKFII